MNIYDPADNYRTIMPTTIMIDLETDDKKVIYIIFRPSDPTDREHAFLAEVITAYKDYDASSSEFGLPCNPGDELAIRNLVIEHYENDNLFWQPREEDYFDDPDVTPPMDRNNFYDYDNREIKVDHVKEILHRIADNFGNVSFSESLGDMEEITQAINMYLHRDVDLEYLD